MTQFKLQLTKLSQTPDLRTLGMTQISVKNISIKRLEIDYLTARYDHSIEMVKQLDEAELVKLCNHIHTMLEITERPTDAMEAFNMLQNHKLMLKNFYQTTLTKTYILNQVSHWIKELSKI